MGSIARRILENMGSRVEVYVTAASTDKQTGLFKFWTQFDPVSMNQVEEQAEHVQFMAQEAMSPRPLEDLQEGDLCMAKYLEDGRWYRARIESVTGNDVIAFFIDYGNTEIIPRSLVRTRQSVGESLFDLPGQATECVLAGVGAVMQHKHVKMGTHSYLKNMLVDQTFIGEPQQLTKDGLEVKLFMQSGDSIAERFMLDDYGVHRGPGIGIPAATPAQTQTSRGYTQTTLAIGSRENLYVSNVVSLSQFWVQQASKSGDLDRLMDSISAQYDGLSLGEKRLGMAQEGSACITTFSEDGVNYRAKVMKVQGPQHCSVQFVDYGNSEVKEMASLKTITDDLLRYPAIAVECSLSGIDGGSCSPRAVGRFEELTADKELCGKVVGMNGSTCCVLLIDPKGEENVDIVSVLVKEGLASRAEQLPPLASPTSPRAGANQAACNGGAGDAGATKSYVEPTISRGSRVVVEIIAVRGTDDFSCQLMDDAEAFNIMMDKLQSDYSSIPSNKGTVKSPKVGQSCCVKFSEDDCWYRARVVSIQGSQVQVQYVDYGNGETVSVSKLKQLKAEYLALPMQCIDCSLDGVPVLEGEEADKAIQWLDQHTEENLVASITGVLNGKYIVILQSEETGAVLNDGIKKILPSKAAEKKSKTPPRARPHQEGSRPVQRTPPKGQSQSPKSASAAILAVWSELKLGMRETDAYISHVEDPNRFFCQLVSQEGELNKLMDEIHTKCVESKLKKVQHACVGTPCVAQFSEDNSWYRGVIKEQRHGFYKVCFVDYGNEEDVPLDKVLEITPDLMSLPQQAASCCLSGWDPAWKEPKVIEHLKKLAMEVEKFRIMVQESKGTSVVQLKWQGKDMLQELRKVRDSIPKEVTHPKAVTPPKAATPPRHKGGSTDSTPPFTIASAVESVAVGKPVMMAASVVKGPTKFFCQLCSQYDQLQQLTAEMNNHYAASKPNKDALATAVPGAFCAAQSSTDGSWYRAKIHHTTVQGKVKVKFVDYGDDDVVAVSSLRNLLPRFRSLPTQAIKCHLSGVRQKFEAVALDQEVTIMVKAKDDGKLEVEYQDDSFRASVQGVFGPALPSASIASPGGSQQVASARYVQQGKLGGTDHDVYVTHVDNLQKFYVQMCSRSDEIDMLQQKLKTSYSGNTSEPLPSATMGNPCCAKFSEDGEWYRAVVTGQPSQGKVVVRFVDFGNSEEQSVSALRPLKAEFLQQTTAAIECRLKGVSSSSPDKADEFQDLTIDKSLKCQFHGQEEPYQVHFPELQAEVKKWQLVEMQQPRPTLKAFPPSKRLTVGTKEEVYVSSVTSPAAFWCQMARHEHTLNELMDSIDAHYRSLAPGEGQMVSPVVGAPCVAQFADDGGWYRAKITKVNPGSCTVTFTDYGNSDTVSKSLIMDIKEDFLAAEPQAVLCSLGGVSPVAETWTQETCDSFSGLTGDKKLLAEVTDVDPVTASHQVTLLDLGMSLGQTLVEKEFAKAVPTSTKSIRFASESEESPDHFVGFKMLDITQGSSEKVYVTVVNSLHEFYCQIAAKSAADLDPLSERLQAEAPSLDSITAESIQGMPCIAKFSDDEQWYRATAIAEKADGVEVFFVDYGNRETIQRDQIKAVTDDFSSLPAQTLKCALAYIPKSSASDDTAVAEFENQVLESEALTAEFISQKGDTWIIRLLNDGQPVAEALGLKLMEEISEPPDSKLKPLAPTSLSYSWAPLTMEQVVEVFVTTVNSPEDFWCQFASSEDDLNIVMDNIQSLVIPMGDNLRPQDLQLRPGHICLAQSAQDGCWYRSEVTEVKGDSTKVLFVDTGKTETVPSVKVRAIEADFMELPRQSFRCQLAGVAPRGQSWDQDATNALRKLTSDHSLMADVLKVERVKGGAMTNVVVSLQDGALSVADLLVEKGHAQAAKIPEYAEEEETGDVIEEQVIRAPCWEGPKYEQALLPTGEREDVVVFCVTSPLEFYCHLVDPEQSARITTEVERHVGEMIGQSRLVPAVGMPCVARCKDGRWQRVEILDVLSDDQVKVFLVDEAQAQVIQVTDLQLITSTLLALPPQAIKCSLGGALSGLDWSEADAVAFRELTEGKTLQAELVGDRVQLFDEEESVLQMMIQRAEDRKSELLKEEGQETPAEANTDLSEAVVVSDNAQKEIGTLDEGEEEVFSVGVDLPDSFKQAFETLDLQVGQDVTLCLVTLDSPDEITCQVTHEDQKVLDIEQRMTEIYTEESETPEDTDWVPKVGEPCAAKHSQYEDWYRATVVSVDQETGVEVFYADYGGTDRVLFESVRELKEELRQFPAQAMRFHLNKPLMPTSMWNKKTKAILEGQDTERDLHAKVLEVQENVILVELADEDHTFLTHLVDQSQTGSLDNEEEDDDEKDGEFFDAVEQASTETDEVYEVADIDDALRTIPAEKDEAQETGDDVQSSVAAVIEDLFEKAAEQAMTDQKQLEAESEDGSGGTAEGAQPSNAGESDSATPDVTVPTPQAPGDTRMISMKDIIDQFVDHTLQNLNREETVDNNKQEEDYNDVVREEEEGKVSDGDEEDEETDQDVSEEEIQEVVNGELAHDESPVTVSEENAQDNNADMQEDLEEPSQESKQGSEDQDDAEQKVSDLELAETKQPSESVGDSEENLNKEDEVTSVQPSDELADKEGTSAEQQAEEISDAQVQEEPEPGQIGTDEIMAEPGIKEEQVPDDQISSQVDTSLEVAASEDSGGEIKIEPPSEEGQEPGQICPEELVAEPEINEEPVPDNQASSQVDISTEVAASEDSDGEIKIEPPSEVGQEPEQICPEETATEPEIKEEPVPDGQASSQVDTSREVAANGDSDEESKTDAQSGEEQVPDDQASLQVDPTVEETGGDPGVGKGAGPEMQEEQLPSSQAHAPEEPTTEQTSRKDLVAEVGSEQVGPTDEAMAGGNAVAEELVDQSKTEEQLEAQDQTSAQVDVAAEMMEGENAVADVDSEKQMEKSSEEDTEI